MIQHVVPDCVREMPAAKYIQRAWPMLPGHVVRSAFKKRDVKINGIRIDQGAAIHGGDELTLFIPDRDVPRGLTLAFDDGRLLAAIKPQGLPVDVDADGIGADTLLTRLRGQYPTAALCHRLDAATGGLVLAAANPQTLEQALAAFKAHALRKRYRALARGGFDKREGTLKAWLVKDARRSEVRIAHRDGPGAKPIETRYRVLSDQNGVAELELEPVTGRTHQLRAHMADFGHPLLGDDKYGDRAFNKFHPGAPLCLWCASLEIGSDSPLANYRGMRFDAPPPDWLSK